MRGMHHHDHTNLNNYSPPPPPEIPAYKNQASTTPPDEGRKYQRPRRQKRNPLLIPLIAVSVLALVMSALYLQTLFAQAQRDTSFAEAVETCDVSETSPYIEVADDGDTLLMTSEGDESLGAPITEIACVFVELEVPSSIINRFETTRALDGTQTGTWDVYEATWNYHPNSGSHVTITVVDPD